MDSRKICILGDFAVGKTSLVRRFVHNQFSERYQTTIGVKVDTKSLVLSSGRDLKLAVWDVVGTDKPTPLFLRYLRGASGYLLVADGTRNETLGCCLELREAVESSIGELPFIGLVNKSDLRAEQEIGDVQLQRLPWDAGDWMRTSALTGDNVEAAFSRLAELMVMDR